MTILEALIQLRDDIKLWCINNFNHKLNKNLGTEESGKFLTVDSSGDIVTTSNYGVRSVATGSTNGTISVNTNGTSAEVAVKGLGSAAYTASTAYDAAGTAQTKADAALASAKAYTDGLIDGLTAEGDANAGAVQAALNIHKGDKNNPHGVTYSQIGAAAASHSHAASDITSGTLSSDRLPTVPVAKGGTGATTASGALNNLGIETGTWTPSIPNIISTNNGEFYGCYMKINNIVTISFYIGTTAIGTDSNDYFYIDASSLPYTPDRAGNFSNISIGWYAGGGHLQGVSAPDENYYFTGWAIDGDKKIYARALLKETVDYGVIHTGTYMRYPQLSSSENTYIYASGTITYKIAT